MIGFEPRICDGESNRCTKECHKQFSFFCDNFDLLFPWTFKERSTFFLDKTALGNITPVEKYMPLTKLSIKEKVTPTFQ